MVGNSVGIYVRGFKTIFRTIYPTKYLLYEMFYNMAIFTFVFLTLFINITLDMCRADDVSCVKLYVHQHDNLPCMVNCGTF